MLPRIHIITDTDIQNRKSHFELAKLAWSLDNLNNIAVQYREKKLFEKEFESILFPELVEISNFASIHNKILIINDYIKLHSMIHCNGFHLGKEDNPLTSIHDSIFKTHIIGFTIHDISELNTIDSINISYIGVGPVFGTDSKKSGLPPLGTKKLNEICKNSLIPVIAIGNLNSGNFNQVLDAGAYGASFLSSFCKSENPQIELELIKSVLDKY